MLLNPRIRSYFFVAIGAIVSHPSISNKYNRNFSFSSLVECTVPRVKIHQNSKVMTWTHKSAPIIVSCTLNQIVFFFEQRKSWTERYTIVWYNPAINKHLKRNQPSTLDKSDGQMCSNGSGIEIPMYESVSVNDYMDACVAADAHTFYKYTFNPSNVCTVHTHIITLERV